MDQFAPKEEVTLKRTGEAGTEAAAPDGALSLAPGRLVAERYKVVCLIGKGAMGAVYEVEQVFLQKRFALKTLNPIGKADVASRRFQKEALAASKLEHPNLVRAYDFGVIDDIQPYFIMDLLQGVTLAQHLQSLGRLSIDATTEIFIPLCKAMGYAHQQGVIHRDIKPSNIMLIKNPIDADREPPVVPKIVDFGIAKLELSDEFEHQALTKTGDVFGTPLYMSPEQCMGGKIDKRSDIYSLGCVLFEALTGAPPFTGANALETMMQHQSAELLSLKEASMGLEFPRYLEQVVAKMLAKNPAGRYQSCEEVLRDLEQKTEREDAGGKKPPDRKLKERPDRRPIFLAAATVAAFGLACLFGFLLLSSSTHDISATRAPSPSGTGEGQLLTALTDDGKQPSDDSTVSLGLDQPFRSDAGDHWQFNFGAKSLGQFAWTAHRWNACDWKNAIRTINTPKHTCAFFKADKNLLVHSPGLLRNFNDGDLYHLEFFLPIAAQWQVDEKYQTACDDALNYAKHLRSLGGLRLSSTPLTVKGLNNIDINGLTKLEHLWVGHTNIDGKDVAQLKILHQLSILDASHLQHGELVVRALKHSPRIQDLYLAQTDLTNASLHNLSGMRALSTLDISDNSQITDRGMLGLTDVPSLSVLYLQGCSVTPAIADFIAQHERLAAVAIRVDRWQIKDVQALLKRFPKVKLIAHLTDGAWSSGDADALKGLVSGHFDCQIERPEKR